MLVITDETRAEIAEALRHRNQHSKRQQCIVGTPDRPTPWDLAHDDIDRLLYNYEAAPDAVA